MSIEELLQKCLSRDASSYDEFIRRYQRLVTRSVNYKLAKLNVRLVRNELEDIVQEIFFSIWDQNKLTGLKDPECLDSYLVMLSINATSNYCRTRELRQAEKTLSLDSLLYPEDNSISLGDIIPSPSLGTERMLNDNEISVTLEKEISELEPMEQLALKLNIYDGKKQKEIATIMALPEGSVATLIYRAKNRLKEKLKDFDIF
jgi:RNA polymerase sigma-70 factor (ECF subfamily)